MRLYYWPHRTAKAAKDSTPTRVNQLTNPRFALSHAILMCMNDGSDGLTLMAELFFIVPAVFAMLASPFWIMAQIKARKKKEQEVLDSLPDEPDEPSANERDKPLVSNEKDPSHDNCDDDC